MNYQNPGAASAGRMLIVTSKPFLVPTSQQMSVVLDGETVGYMKRGGDTFFLPLPPGSHRLLIVDKLNNSQASEEADIPDDDIDHLFISSLGLVSIMGGIGRKLKELT